MKKNKTEKPAMPRKSRKKVWISLVAVVLVLGIGCSLWYYFGHRSTDPVGVYSFMSVGMTEYWGDVKESYGPVTTDKIQTVYLSGTQTVTEVFVQPGDEVTKGTPLMAFDTTLSDLALERKRLEVEKLKLQLEDAEASLKQIKAMKPMVIHPGGGSKPPKPEEPGNAGRPLNGKYEIVSPKTMDGSAMQKAIICWLGQTTPIDQDLLKALAVKAGELQVEETEPTEPTEPTQPTQPETTAPEEPEETKPTEPETEPTDPTGETGSAGAENKANGTEAEPEPAKDFYVVLKITAGNTSNGQTLTWQGIRVIAQNGSYAMYFFDASNIKDPVTPPPTEPEDNGPDIDYNSGYTASQIAQMRADAEKRISDLKFSIKMAQADYKIMQCETASGIVAAEIDGTVVSVLTPEEALMNQQPMIKVSGGGGFYVEGSVSELDKDNLVLGQEVTIMDWYTGMSLTGTVQKIADYPAQDNGYTGMGNPNVSYYPFTVFVEGDADLQEGSYVSIQYSPAEEAQSGIYLEKAFIRTENGKSYVYVRGEDGTLEKRFVTTGKALWGSYLEILDGISAEDFIAFPYGKNVQEGAATVESDLSELYGY